MQPDEHAPGFEAGLLEPSAWPWAAAEVTLVETHISRVFLAGEFACKFKKPLDLGFLDFRSAEQRLALCREELRLNRRFAPELYLDLVGARRTPHGWRVGSWQAGDEPGVRMHRFPAGDRLDKRLESDDLAATALEVFAAELAGFQQALPAARPAEGYGDAATVARPALANFVALPGDGLDADQRAQREALERWTRRQAATLASRFDDRLAAGWVREGHGDMHLANLVMLGARVVAFDGIEFDPALRWIDVQSEVAFLLMDLESRGRADLGWRFCNAWLATLGDYDGLALLPWYLVYRHMVRAKIDGIRLGQAGVAAQEVKALQQRQSAHLALAHAHAVPPAPLLVLMHGLSGSGKSRLARRLAPLLPAAWVRSDLERKRLHGLDPFAPAPAGVDAGLYDPHASARTYARLADISRAVLGAGLNLVVDAAFLEAGQRLEFIQLARALNARPVVLACEAPADVLRERVAARRGDPSDAGLAVLESQLLRDTSAVPGEAGVRLSVDTSRDPDAEALARRLLEHPARLAR